MLLKVEDEYFNEGSWAVRENANVPKSISGFYTYLLGKYLRSEVEKMIPHFELHKAGVIHIHKLPMCIHMPYCAGWDWRKLLLTGIATPNISTSPPKHTDTALLQLAQFFLMSSQEFTGAQAVTAWDMHIAPFAELDGISKQDVQRMLYNLNYAFRTSYQSPFTNITLLLGQAASDIPAVFRGRELGDSLTDFMDGAIEATRLLIQNLLDGDARGAPFTFPIVTLAISPNFDWNDRKWDGLAYELFRLASRRGLYFLNGYALDLNALFAMCCRLISQVRGIWSLPPAVGSINVVTLNLPHIIGMGLDLQEVISKCIDILEFLYDRVSKVHSAGLLPLTKKYLECFHSFYKTIGILGLPEAVRILGYSNVQDYISKARKLLGDIVKLLPEEGYNIEQVPAESAAYRLAKIDRKILGDYVPVYDGYPLYSNSNSPDYLFPDFVDKVEIEASLQKCFSGGVIWHIYLNQSADPDALRKLVYRLAQKDIIYFSITPHNTVCNSCKRSMVGAYDKCPYCGSKNVEVWSRIVGYYRPLRMWNEARAAEFKHRLSLSMGAAV